MSCIFCDIVDGSAPANVEYEDERVVAFADIHSKVPVHILIVPKKHIASVFEMNENDKDLFGHMVWVAKNLAEQKNLEGYKLLFNVGEKGGQIVFHVHLHLMG
jgi:histidine triad (HIT) family protein